MAMPLMGQNKIQRVKIPSMDGGLNINDSASAVQDNQVTDCMNVWWNNGQLETRPKLTAVSFPELNMYKYNMSTMQVVNTTLLGQPSKIFAIVDKETATKSNIVIIVIDTNGNCYRTNIQNEGYMVKDFFLYKGQHNKINSDIQTDDGIYILSNWIAKENGEIISRMVHTFRLVELSKVSIQCNGFEISNEDYMYKVAYIPHAIINGLGDKYGKLPTSSQDLPSATQLEGFNCISGMYKCTFTSDNISEGFVLATDNIKGDVKIKINVSNMACGSPLKYKSKKVTDIAYHSLVVKPEANQSGSSVRLLTKITPGTSEYDASTIKYKIGYSLDVIEFNIPDGKSESNEMYQIDGTFPFYNDNGKKEERTYVKTWVRAKINRNTGYVYFTAESHQMYWLQAGSSKVADINFPPEEQGNNNQYYGTLQSSIIVDSTTPIQLPNANIVYVSNYDLGINGSSSSDIPKTECPGTGLFHIIGDNVRFPFPRCGSIHNNIEIYASCDITAEFDNLCTFNQCELFTGAEGLSGGVRTFCGGGVNKNEIRWTDENRALYFPENCYNNLGDINEKITGFGKQGSYLIVFKEHSIWTVVNEGAVEYSGNDVTNQAVVDITSLYKFGSYKINSGIGCNLPNTIQLCLNRLMWANDDGNVYTLTGMYTDSEKNVHCVSGLIKKKLKKESFNKAYALDWQGRYLLFTDKNVYVLDYNRNAYRYVSSYTRDSAYKSSSYFSWWIWNLIEESDFQFAVSSDDKIMILNNTKANTNVMYTLNTDEYEDSQKSMIQTKFFSFSSPDYYKGVETVCMEIGNAAETDLFVTHITDGKEYEDEPIHISKESDITKSTYGKEVIFYPRLKMIRKYGLKIESNGPLGVAGMIINYRLKGGINRNGY